MSPCRIGGEVVRGTKGGTMFVRYLPSFRSLGAAINGRVNRGFNVARVRIASRIFRDPRSVMFSRTRGHVRAVGTIVTTALI